MKFPHSTLVLTLALAANAQTPGPALTEDQLFAQLDLTHPGLEAVQSAADRAAARHALAEYYRHRAKPLYFIALGEKANPKPSRPDVTRGDRALRHEFVSIGYPHSFGPTIDWHFDKTAEPGSQYAPNNEWTWQLNRHAEWLALSRAYRDTSDEKYAREFVAQMTSWAHDCPMPADAANGPRSAWRTIETGIRASDVWPELWYPTFWLTRSADISKTAPGLSCYPTAPSVPMHLALRSLTSTA